MTNPQKTRGRPPKAPDEMLVLRSIRLKPHQWQKVDEHGIDWLRGLIDKARRAKTPVG